MAAEIEGWRRAPHSNFRLTGVVHRIHFCHARQDDDRLPGLDQRFAGPRGCARIQVRVDRLVHGNPGSHRALREGVSELKIDIQPEH